MVIVLVDLPSSPRLLYRDSSDDIPAGRHGYSYPYRNSSPYVLSEHEHNSQNPYPLEAPANFNDSGFHEALFNDEDNHRGSPLGDSPADVLSNTRFGSYEDDALGSSSELSWASYVPQTTERNVASNHPIGNVSQTSQLSTSSPTSKLTSYTLRLGTNRTLPRTRRPLFHDKIFSTPKMPIGRGNSNLRRSAKPSQDVEVAVASSVHPWLALDRVLGLQSPPTHSLDDADVLEGLNANDRSGLGYMHPNLMPSASFASNTISDASTFRTPDRKPITTSKYQLSKFPDEVLTRKRKSSPDSLDGLFDAYISLPASSQASACQAHALEENSASPISFMSPFRAHAFPVTNYNSQTGFVDDLPADFTAPLTEDMNSHPRDIYSSITPVSSFRPLSLDSDINRISEDRGFEMELDSEMPAASPLFPNEYESFRECSFQPLSFDSKPVVFTQNSLCGIELDDLEATVSQGQEQILNHPMPQLSSAKEEPQNIDEAESNNLPQRNSDPHKSTSRSLTTSQTVFDGPDLFSNWSDDDSDDD